MALWAGNLHPAIVTITSQNTGADNRSLVKEKIHSYTQYQTNKHVNARMSLNAWSFKYADSLKVFQIWYSTFTQYFLT